MKKVINLLGLRKAAINLKLENLPKEVDLYIAEIASNDMDELHQIEKAIKILSEFDASKKISLKNT